MEIIVNVISRHDTVMDVV